MICRVIPAIGVFLTCFALDLEAGPPQDLSPGLAATYRDHRHSVRLSVSSHNFFLAAGESVHPSLDASFQARWDGWISILQSGTYSFSGAQVAIGRQEVTDEGIPLDAGRHPIRITHQRKPGQAALRFEWKAEHFDWEPVPESRFSHDSSSDELTQDRLIEHGRALARKLRCLNCHSANSDSLKPRLGPLLTDIGSRTKRPWLYHWLSSPTAFRSDATMPSILDDQQRRDVAAYLASLEAKEPTPEIKQVRRQEQRRGSSILSTFGCGACHQHKSLTLKGLGSKTTLGALAEYLIEPGKFDPSGAMPSMMLTREEATQVAGFLLQSRNPAFEQDFEGGDPELGKELVRTSGCLSCHELGDPQPLTSDYRAPDLKRLNPGHGCLAEKPPPEVPNYRLARAEREALQAFVRKYSDRPDVSRAPVYEFYQALEDLRCLSCHAMGPVGPRGPIPEIAPPLTAIGEKVSADWIKHVLINKQRIHKGLELRMPHYDASEVEPLIAGFAQAAGLKPGGGPKAPSPGETAQARGVGILGVNGDKGGMGCIGCHGWRERRSLGENGPYLTHAAERLRYDWFHRWMRDPARIISGTSMPNYFGPMDPGEAREKIDALWAALSMGESMPLPEGFTAVRTEPGSEAQPVPTSRPIVIRWDMPEATPSAFAVGLPGGVSYCFDAGESRLRYAWLGGYVDMTGTLYEKRDRATRLTRTADLVGEVFYRPEGFPLRVGDPDRIPQRRFRGYRLIDGYPEFHYQVDGIDVYEKARPTAAKNGVLRDFRVKSVQQPMWFIADEPEGAEMKSSLGTATEGRFLIPQGTDVAFQVVVTREDR